MKLYGDKDKNCGDSWLHGNLIDRDIKEAECWFREAVCRHRCERWRLVVNESVCNQRQDL